MKKGFTLVELLGVIVIMTIIMLMASVGVSSLKKGINKSMWNSTVNLIIEGAKKYGEDNKWDIDGTCGSTQKCIIVSVDKLLLSGYITTKEYYTNDSGENVKTIINKTIEPKDSIKNNLDSGYYANNMDVKIWIENGTVYAELVSITEVTSSVTWDQISVSVKASSGANITKYHYSIDNQKFIESDNNTYTFKGLTENTTHQIQVKTSDENGNYSNVYTLSATTSNYVYPKVTKVDSTATYNSIKLTVSATKGTGKISKYYYSSDGGKTYKNSTSNTYTFSNLESSKTYSIKVYVLDVNGKKSSVTTKSVTTNAYVLPSITNITQTTTYNSIKLTVTASNGTGTVSKYYYSSDGGKTYKNTTSNTYTFSNLTESTTYSIKIYVVDSNGKQSAITTRSIKTSAYVLPKITSISASATTSTIKVTLAVTKGTGTISKYYYSSNGGSSYTESTSNTHTFTGLSAGNTYNIKAYVKDSNGKSSSVSSKSVEVSKLTLSDVCSSGNNLASCVKTLAGKGSTTTDIYIHNSSLKNGAGDNSYRYAGSNPNNYVCFGSTATTCPTDNLYRIIGVFGSQVKLVKSTYATSALLGTNGDYVANDGYNWSTTAKENNWTKSSLNKINLNTNFINKIGSTWSSKIATTKWIVGGNLVENITYVVPSETYKNEIVSPSNSTTYSAKVGLIYVSDYAFAASPSAWTTPVFDYDQHINNNWLYHGSKVNYENTITREDDGYTDGYVLYIFGTGDIHEGYLEGEARVRPTFYLTSSVKYSSGSGSASSPIRLS